MKAPVSAIPVVNGQFELFADVSSVGLGAMLAQDGKAIAYTTRTLNSVELNYVMTQFGHWKVPSVF